MAKHSKSYKMRKKVYKEDIESKTEQTKNKEQRKIKN